MRWLEDRGLVLCRKIDGAEINTFPGASSTELVVLFVDQYEK